ncbi:hypothetical protein COOONC_18080 [Cooperia oncophora]
MACVCGFLGGRPWGSGCQLPNGQFMGRALRKEYRVMTDDERNRFHSAMRLLKGSGVFDAFARIHTRSVAAGGAHSGPAFLPWHREFLKRSGFDCG